MSHNVNLMKVDIININPNAVINFFLQKKLPVQLLLNNLEPAMM